MGLGGGEESGMGAAKANRNAKSLAAAHGDLHAELGHRGHQHLGHWIDSSRDHDACGAGGGDQGRRVPQPATGPRQLQQQAKNTGKRIGIARRGGFRRGGFDGGQQCRWIHALQDDAQGLGPGAQNGQGLGEEVGIHQEAPGLGLAAGAETEAHRLGRRRALIKQGGIGNRQPGELGDQGLEVEQGLQSPLGNLRLVGGVGGVPGWVFEHVPLQQRRRHRGGIAQANQAAAGLVGGGDLGQFRQGLGLVAALGQSLAS